MLRDHVLCSQAIVKCLWRDCDVFMYTEENKQVKQTVKWNHLFKNANSKKGPIAKRNPVERKIGSSQLLTMTFNHYISLGVSDPAHIIHLILWMQVYSDFYKSNLYLLTKYIIISQLFLYNFRRQYSTCCSIWMTSRTLILTTSLKIHRKH